MQDGVVTATRMPEGMTAQVDLLREYACNNPEHVIIEKTGTYRPGNSGPAACKFARHCGHLESALYAMGVPVLQIPPSKWMKALGTLPGDKAARKRAIKEEVARRYPDVSVTLATADALGMMVWATASGLSR